METDKKRVNTVQSTDTRNGGYVLSTRTHVYRVDSYGFSSRNIGFSPFEAIKTVIFSTF